MIKTIANYQIISTLYESQQTLIYRVEQLNLAKNIPKSGVLKMLKVEYPSNKEIEQIQKEFEFINYFQSDFIIQAYQLDFHNNRPFIFIEDFNAISVKDYLNKRDKISLEDFFLIAISVTKALAEIHSKNLIHKDINPSNILINNDHKIVKLIDFGLSTKLSREYPDLKSIGYLEGTLAYLSPEQTGRMNRSLDYRSDFYSLGITFYELLTGNIPFENRDKLELIHAHLAKETVAPYLINSEIPVCLSNMVMKLMAKQAEDRYQSAWGILQDLETIKHNLDNAEFLTNFEIAKNDFSDKFQITQKLYGREKQTEILLTTFNDVAKGFNHLLLIAGYSGIGKTSLVQEIYKPITEKKGYFIAGKFDQLQRNKPYSALLQAMQSLLQQILSEDEPILKKWQQSLHHALGDKAQLIIEVLPMLELIIGKQLAPTELPPQEAQQRFNITFQNFIRACCDKEHLLTLFIDDLQWIDTASLKLLPIISDIPYLLLIGAYRDNEVDITHPLIKTLSYLQKIQVNIRTLTLEPLQINHIKQLLIDSLYKNHNEVHSLAELLLEKSAGNPFFMAEFLKSLYYEELLNFNHVNKVWQWNIEQIQQKNITDNVVDLLVNKINRLPRLSRELLSLGAILGNTIDLELLAISAEINLVQVKQYLWFCLEQGLLMSLGETEYKFVHDKVQQAAYSLIKESQRPTLHLKIGRLLKNKLSADELAEQLFTVVDHLNLGISLLDELAEKKQLAQLNVESGHKAKKANAYALAFSYFKTALSQYQESDWQQNYLFMLSLHDELATSAFLSGEMDTADQYLDAIFTHAQKVLDKINAAETKINSLSAQLRYQDAIYFAIDILKELGFDCPIAPTEKEIDILFKKTNQLFKSCDILSLPMLEDPQKLAILRILSQLTFATYGCSPPLFLWINTTMIYINLLHGHHPVTPYIFAAYTFCLNHAQELETCRLARDVAIKLVEKEQFRNLQKKVYFLVACSAIHISQHLKDAQPFFQSVIDNSLAEGDPEYLAHGCVAGDLYSFYASKELNWLKDNTKNNALLLQKKQSYIVFIARLLWQTTINLTEMTNNPTHLEGIACNEREFIKYFTENNVSNGLGTIYQLKLALAVLFRETNDIIKTLEKAENSICYRFGFVEVPILMFHGSLIYLKLCRDNIEEKENYLACVKENQINLKIWAFHAPMNFQHKYDLVKAEIARIEGNFDKAAQYYEKAIKGASESNYLNDEALSYELTGEFYLSHNLERIAKTYLIEARFVYQRWGAFNKVNQLEKNYAFLQPKKSISFSSNISVSDSYEESEKLDLLSIVKASQAITSEIKLERLLQELLKILLANAGASRGVILLPDKQQWLVQADSDNHERVELINISIDDYNQLPTILIHYVIRTQEKILMDKFKDSNFTKDSYFDNNPPLSLLCLPLIQQHKIIGILYLENNLLTDAFTIERVKLLEILSGQIIISIENTLLYRGLEEKVMERTIELNTTINELQLAQNMLADMAYKDALTMLYNRRGLDHTLQDNSVFEKPLTVIMCDIDHFKLVNDRYGHSIGDIVIQTFARIITEVTRKTDICVRWGGEEFLILLPLTNASEAFIVAEKIRISCEQQTFPEQPELSFTSSFGICAKKDSHRFDTLVHDADQALYQAKTQGRNQVCLFNCIFN
jgi:diguanylate cyclase (GGDEF)-like protein